MEGLAPADSSWMLMLPDIQEALKGHCNGHDASTEIQQDEAEEDEGVLLSEVLQEIRTLLKKGFYTQAVAVVKKAIAMYPESNLFCASESSPEAPESQADEEQENGESDKPCLVDVLRKIYQGGSRPDDPLVDGPEAFCRDENPIPEMGGGDAVAEANGAVLDDLSKQKIVVRYLEDCVHFAKQMKTIVPTLCDLLRSPTVSDVQETIAFFVSAHRFGVEDASVGLREMLPLMWSAEAGVREAVVSSYREVYFDAKSGGNSRSKVSDIADSLSLLVSTATADELLSLKKLAQNLCNSSNCTLRTLNFDFYPAHVSNLKIYAYRPIIIQELLRQAGAVLWLEPDYQLTAAPDPRRVVGRALREGLAAPWSPEPQPTSALTHLGMFEYLGAPREAFFFHRMVDPSVMLLFDSPQVRGRLMLPWVRCALVAECITPVGAQSTGCRFDKKPLYRYSGCHRYDMSALNVILGLLYSNNQQPYVFPDEDHFFKRLPDGTDLPPAPSLSDGNTTGRHSPSPLPAR
ncbi:hypothetical protein ISCGN_009226 [Ixodes scapularis]